MAALFFASLRKVDLKPEQKTQIEAIETDLENLGQQHKPAAQKLGSDIADGVAAGKIDHKKTDADVRDVVKAVEATLPGVQEGVNRLYKTLDPAQRKTIVDDMRARAADMKEHAGMMGEHGMMGDHGMMGHGMMGHDHGGPPPAGGPAAPAPGSPAAPPPGGPPAGAGAPPPPGGPGMAHGGPGMGGPGPHGGPGMGGPGPQGRPGAGPEGNHGEMMMEHLGDMLGLTPDQRTKLKTKLDAQMKTAEAQMKARAAAAQKQMKAIGDAFATDKFDAKKAGVGQHAPELAKNMATHEVTFAENVLSVLTPEQRPKFAEHLRTHMSAHD